VLLLRERHHDGWGLPGGLLRRRERPVDAVRRELVEEVDLAVAEAAFGPPLVVVDPTAHRVDVVFVADVPDGTDAVAQEPEVLEARWFTISELPELFEPTADALRTVGYAVQEIAAR
jgi:ADP-ribose pyrophosphatase YjhB (NUDIX family)